MKKLLFLAMFFDLLALSAKSTTYYLDTTGSDLNNGLTKQTASPLFEVS